MQCLLAQAHASDIHLQFTPGTAHMVMHLNCSIIAFPVHDEYKSPKDPNGLTPIVYTLLCVCTCTVCAAATFVG